MNDYIMDSSESLTPPGSPVLGYSGLRKSGTTISSEYSSQTETSISTESFPVYTFACKGPILARTSDHSFSSNGLFLRKQAITTIKLLKKNLSHNDDDGLFSSPEESSKEKLYTILGHNFNPFDRSEFSIVMKMVQKRIFTLMNLTRPSFTTANNSSKHSVNINSSKATVSNPFQIRHNICQVFNLLVAQRDLLNEQFGSNNNAAVMSDDVMHELFNGLRKCLGTVSSTWSSTLKFHCGSKEGNDCTSPDFHLFHLHLELRFALLIISGLNSTILDWIIQDLLELSYLKHQSNSQSSLDGVSPFNCYCVKELWSMLRVIIDHVNPTERKFWDIIIPNLVIKCSNVKSKLFFPLWMLSHLVSLYDYELNGMYSPLAGVKDESVNNSTASCCYTFVNHLLKEWLQSGGKTIEVIQHVRRFIPYWGFDLEIFTTFWAHLLPRLDKGFELDSMRHFGSAITWYKLISLHIGRDDKGLSHDKDNPISTDPFLEFLKLLYLQIKICSVKDWRKLKSSLCNRLTPKIVGTLNEFGLARVATMYMVLAYGTDDSLAMCERLNETLRCSKELFLNTSLRARCTMILLLLAKSINLSTISSELVKTIDEIIITSARNAAQKDFVMIYVEMLEHLASYGTNLNLGQSQLIPSNLTVWLTNCGHNHIVRTLQALHNLFERWILKDNSTTDSTSSGHFSCMNSVATNNEKAIVAELIETKTLQFLKQSVAISAQQQFTSDFDIKPFADLAADITIVHGLLQHLYMNADIVAKLFEYFAVNDKTCPNVSERYISQIIKSKWSWNGIISDVLLIQCWIRLVFFNYDVPLQLSVHVLSLNNDISFPAITSHAESLLTQFCQVVNESENSCWNRPQLQAILGPTIAISKTIVSSTSFSNSSSNTQAESKLRMESFIKSCLILFRQIKFDKIYVRNGQSFVHHMLDTLCPPFVGKLPWEKLPQSVVGILRKYLPEFFIAIVSYDPWIHDPYLKRKLGDIIRFSFLGYTNAEELDATNPGLIIMQFCEKHPKNEILLHEISSSFQNVTKEVQITKKFLLTVLGFLKRHMITAVMSLIHSVLEILIEKEIEYTNICTNILSHVCATVMVGKISNCDRLKRDLVATFDTVMLKHFAFRSKKFFDFFAALASSSSSTNSRTLPLLKRFIKLDLVPLVQNYIDVSEAKQGSGTNYTLRRQLAELEKRLTDVSV